MRLRCRVEQVKQKKKAEISKVSDQRFPVVYRTIKTEVRELFTEAELKSGNPQNNFEEMMVDLIECFE